MKRYTIVRIGTYTDWPNSLVPNGNQVRINSVIEGFQRLTTPQFTFENIRIQILDYGRLLLFVGHNAMAQLYGDYYQIYIKKSDTSPWWGLTFFLYHVFIKYALYHTVQKMYTYSLAATLFMNTCEKVVCIKYE